MKNIIAICIAGLFIMSAFGAVARPGDVKNQGKNLATHTIIGEYSTATWCGYCQYAHGALKALYKDGRHDFYYVSFVDDKNTHAAARNTELGVTGFPTVNWDGKYRTNVGAGSIPSAMAAYNSSLIACGARTVPNIDLSISATWLGSATMSITVTVTNHQASTYTGYLRCYVTEIASSMGWYDTAGQLYTFPFLDYAINQAISAPASGTWSNTVTWNGALFNDGFGHTFAGLTQDNAFITAAVFASSGGYVDETAGFRVGSNRAPGAPSSPSPTNGTTNVQLNPTLSWQCIDPDWFDTLFFDVYFEKGDATPDVLVSNDQTGTTFNPGALDMESTYYWQIVVHDEEGLTANGPIWSFTSRGNDPPNTPKNPNPANGTTNVPINKVLSWTGGDPNGDPVKYDVYFGTTNPPSKVTSNQSSASYNSGTMIPLTTYYWKIVAWDNFGLSATGPSWQFISGNIPNNPPNKPSISGEAQGKPGKPYTYVFTATDPDQDNLSYFVDWGDNTSEQWNGPHASGAEVSITHTWTVKGTYNIKAKVKDVHDAESDWGTLEIKIPTNQFVPHSLLLQFLHRILERFPILERLFIQ